MLHLKFTGTTVGKKNLTDSGIMGKPCQKQFDQISANITILGSDGSSQVGKHLCEKSVGYF